jgi:hypothetical protein
VGCTGGVRVLVREGDKDVERCCDKVEVTFSLAFSPCVAACMCVCVLPSREGQIPRKPLASVCCTTLLRLCGSKSGSTWLQRERLTVAPRLLHARYLKEKAEQKKWRDGTLWKAGGMGMSGGRRGRRNTPHPQNAVRVNMETCASLYPSAHTHTHIYREGCIAGV